VTVSILHTADWQIGKAFGAFNDETRVVLARQRLATIETIAKVARDERVDAVLVAGDVFDMGAVRDETIRRTLNALAAFAGPWVLLPGNHDAAVAESPWTRIPRLSAPGNVILATEPNPIPLLDQRLTILPAPLQRRREAIDLTRWFDDAESAPGAIRIGLAHGSVTGLLPGAADAANPIAADRAERARLDYLALGDWHGTLEVNARTWYAGTPEADRFKANDQGNVLIVRIEAPGVPPRVTKRRVGRYHWREVTRTIYRGDDVAALSDGGVALGNTLAETVLKLTLSGAIDLATRAAVNAALDALRARVLALDVDDDALIARPSDDDLEAMAAQGFVRRAVERLRAQATDARHPERDIAALALEILYLENQRQVG
jgi:DNA repair exonuclease SbcCD nuclease subunit